MLELHFPDFIKFNQRRYANGKPRLRWEEYQRAKAHHEIRRRPNQMWSVWGECWKTLEGGTLTDDPALAKDRSVNVIADKLLAPVCDIPLVEGATSPTKLSDRPYGSTLSLKDKVFDPKKNCWVYQYTQEPVWESDGRTLNEKSLENIERIGTLFSSPMSEGSLVDKNKKFPVGGDYVTVERRSSVGGTGTSVIPSSPPTGSQSPFEGLPSPEGVDCLASGDIDGSGPVNDPSNVLSGSCSH